jgi:beta-1,4-mannosyl-glycoprotein beta-1,4-N-acetylglucosaminyltransferase
MSRLFDCFTYDNEDFVYDRIAMLASVVDRFYIVEGSHTYQGEKRPLAFDLARLSEPLRHKVHHSVCDLTEVVAGGDAWAVEHAQRNALMSVLDEAEDDDFILLSDVDEIPLPSVLARPNLKPARLCMLNCYFYSDYVCQSKPVWKRAALFRKHQVAQSGLSFQNIRVGKMDNRLGILPDAGLHLSYLGGVDRIYDKLAKFAHSELRAFRTFDRAVFEARIREGHDVFDRGGRWGRLEPLPPVYAEFDANFIAAHRAPNDVRAIDMAFFESAMKQTRRMAAAYALRSWFMKRF